MNLTVCHQCPHRERPCNGRCACTADPAGRDIIVLARLNACPLGLFGNPVAPERREEGKSVAATIARGATGVAKAVLGIDRADPATITARRAVCADCPHNVGRLLQRCEVCGCGLAAKTVLKGESCPIGKWPSVSD